MPQVHYVVLPSCFHLAKHLGPYIEEGGARIDLVKMISKEVGVFFVLAPRRQHLLKY